MNTQARITTVTKTETLPRYLVATHWLEENLESQSLRVFDCAVIAGPNPDSELGKTFPFAFESGQDNYESSHIPGAGFIDVLGDLSDPASPLPLMLPPEKQFVEAMSKYGISDDANVVLYSSTEPMWAARVWWMLRAFGFNNATILDGGWTKWVSEQRPVSKNACTYPPGTFNASQVPGLLVGKNEVLQATVDEGSCIINALPPAMHAGTGGPVFGRKGRIAGSTNVPSSSVQDPETGTYLSVEKLRKIFADAGADDARRVITYCGGGIASSNDAFALTLAGYANVAVYDASMFEWGNNPSLPMEAD